MSLSDLCPAQRDGRKLTVECQHGWNGLVVGVLLTCTPSGVLPWWGSEGMAYGLRKWGLRVGNLVVAQTGELATMYTGLYKYYRGNRNDINEIEWQEAGQGPGWWNGRDPGTRKESMKSGIESKWPFCIGSWQSSMSTCPSLVVMQLGSTSTITSTSHHTMQATFSFQALSNAPYNIEFLHSLTHSLTHNLPPPVLHSLMSAISTCHCPLPDQIVPLNINLMPAACSSTTIVILAVSIITTAEGYPTGCYSEVLRVSLLSIVAQWQPLNIHHKYTPYYWPSLVSCQITGCGQDQWYKKCYEMHK